jgi:hypothetical protein
MRVVSAGMRDADSLRNINRSHCRGVWQTSVLLDGKRVHISPREHGLSVAVPQNAHDAGLPNPFQDFVTEFLEFRRCQRGCFAFLKTQFGICMELLVNMFLPTGGRLESGQHFCDWRHWKLVT